MEYFALFNLLILALFFLSRVLTSEIYSFVYQITKKENFSTNILAFLFFPGVVIHEMAHYITAKLLLVPTGKISLLPKRDGNYVRLGSVSIAKSDMFKEFLIGIAPLLVGVTLILSLVYLVIIDTGFTVVKIILSIYAIFLISNTMYASRKDFQAAIPFIASAITVGIVLFVIGFRLPAISIEWLPSIEMTEVFFAANIYLAVPILIDLAVILLLRVFNRMW